MTAPQQILKDYFGFDRFREGQAEAIQRVLRGQHTLLVMPTGSGKSLTYQLPALIQSGLTLVISPLIALMKDQVDHLLEIGITATYINSSLPTHEVNRRMRAVLEGHVKLLYIAPERLRNRAFTRALAKTKISLLAVDEAHCISQWGHDFRPDYLQIGPIWQAMGQPTLLATTATATPTVQQDIVKLLGISQNIQPIVTGFNRPNLTFRVIQAPDMRTKLQTLQAMLPKIDGSVIVYAATRRNTDEVADFISDVIGMPARAYHAGLDRDTRYRVQTDFMADRFKIVVATNAFGMGVDKSDVRTVIHYNLPATVEAYYQEAGRAGRDGLPADCTLFFAPDDQRLQNWMINSDTPTADDLHQIYTRFSQAANDAEVYFTLNELAQITGLHQVKVRVTLSELEQAGAIYHLGDQAGYGRWKVLPLSAEAFDERARAINRRAQIRLDLLSNMIDYVYLTSCRRRFLLNYFGDNSQPNSPRCCDNHGADTIDDLPKAVTPGDWYPLIVLETVRSLQQRPVGRNRLAQLLNGSQAKAMVQFGYQSHKFYGKLSMLSQPQIMTVIDALLSDRYLQLAGAELPVLALSSLGLKALESRVAIPIDIPDLPSAGATAAQQVDRWQQSSQPQPRPSPQSPTVPAASPVQVILEAVARLNGTLGRTGLAQFLNGSRAGWLEQFAEHSAYGQLSHLSQKAIMNIIDTLIAEGKLMTSRGFRPKLILPDQSVSPAAAKPEADEAPQPVARPPRQPVGTDQPVATPVDSQSSASSQSVDPDPNLPTPTGSDKQDPVETILAVMSDLDGLITIEGLAQLLAAGPDEVVSFSDHEMFACFHGKLTVEDISVHIQTMLEGGQLSLNRAQRLILP